MRTTSDPLFRLTWSPTWPDKPDSPTDFEAKDPAHPHAFCRIYKASSAPDLGWYWTTSDGHRHSSQGYEPTARKAAVRAEEVYFAAPTD